MLLVLGMLLTIQVRWLDELMRARTDETRRRLQATVEQMASRAQAAMGEVAARVKEARASGGSEAIPIVAEVIALETGEEFLFIGDIGWSLDNITEQKLRPAATIARVKEDPLALTHQMTWIKQVMDNDGIIVVPSHDDVLLTRFVADGVLSDELR